MYHGDIRLGDTIDIKFTTRRFSTGAPFTLAGTPSVAAYPSNSTTEITAGITLTVDFDARTGLNNVRVVATGGNGYVTATNYTLVITAGTVDSVSVVGECVGSFSIEARSALMPATAARTLNVSAAGVADADAVAISTDTVAADRLETMLDGTGGNTLSLGQLNIVNSAGSAIVASSTGSNGHGIVASGNGTGEGISATGGATGHGISARGGATSGDGISAAGVGVGNGIDAAGTGTGIGINAQGGGADGDGVRATGGGVGVGIHGRGSTTGAGIRGEGGATGHGIVAAGGVTSGDGFRAAATGIGTGANLVGTGSNSGLRATGGAVDGPGIEGIGTGAGPGMRTTGGATGHGIHARGGATSGDGLHAEAPTSGDGIEAIGAGLGRDLNVDQLPAALVGGRMDSSVGAMAANVVTAAAIAPDAIDADALAASAITEIQAWLATALALAAVQADTDDIQTRLPAALVGGRIDASVGAMAANTLTAAALAADAVTEIQAAILSDATPFAGANVDAAISTRATPAQVNAEVVDALSVDTYAEPTGVPPATDTIANKMGRLHQALRNQVVVNSNTAKKQFFDDAGVALWEKDLTDVGGVYTETEGNVP